MSGLIRPATPGFIITLAAAILLAIVSFSVPIIKSVYFLKASLSADGLDGDITFGTLGYCLSVDTSTTCSAASVGYELNVNALVGNTTPIQIPQLVIKWLTYVLVLHIVAFGLAAIAALFGLLAHVREMSMSCFSSCISGFAATVALAAFIFDIALFFVAKSRMNGVQGGSASIGSAVWLTLIAWVLLFFSGCFYGIGRCCIKRRSRDAWGGKVGTPIGENGYSSHDQLRLDAIKAEADRKARQAQPEGGLPAFHEYDQSQPLRARIDGDEVYLEDDSPYHDNHSVSTAGNTGTGSYGRAAGRGYTRGGYVQAPHGTRAVDEYNAPHRRASNMTHSTTATTPSTYPPSSTALPPTVPVATMYDAAPDNSYNNDPYGPHAYGHNPSCRSSSLSFSHLPDTSLDNPPAQQPRTPYTPFSPDAYNATQSLYGASYNPSRSPSLQPDRGYTLGGTPYGANISSAAPANDPTTDPYYGHYQGLSHPTPPPMSRSPLGMDTQVVDAPTSASPVRGPRGPKNNIVMAPPSSSVQYTDSPPTYEAGQPSAPGRWGNNG